MTDKQEFQLVAPLIAGAGGFVLFLLVMRMTGNLNRYVWKALLASAGLLAYALYLTFWQNEIMYLWSLWPLLVIFGLLLSLLIPCGLFYWIWRVQVAAKADKVAIASAGPRQDVFVDSPFERGFRLVVLAWGVVNLLGLLIAILYAAVHRR